MTAEQLNVLSNLNPTEEELTHRKEKLQAIHHRRKTLLGRVDNQVVIVNDLLESADVEMMRTEVATLDKKLLELMEANERYEEQVDTEEGSKAFEFANEIDSTVFEIKRKVCTWVKNHDCMSSRASHHSSVRPRHRAEDEASVASNLTNNSHISQKSVDNKAELAALRTEANLTETK